MEDNKEDKEKSKESAKPSNTAKFANIPKKKKSLVEILSTPTMPHTSLQDFSNYFNIINSPLDTAISVIGAGINYSNILGNPTFDNQLKLNEDINELRRRLQKTAEELKDTKNTIDDRENKIVEFEKLISELTAKEKTNHILTRISEEGRVKILDSVPFLELFKNSNKCDAVVVSIDIRRSTELMLKARTPELFSKFITELSFKLSQVIISNFGIFDKFTGDGILAFFPKFYSGNNAIIRAIRAAEECHQVFFEHYNNSKECFNVFIKDVGLGIGIDYGNVTLVNTQNELTVVGIPVVYACRFSNAKAGETLINRPAMEEVNIICQAYASISEGEIHIKNEGIAVGYYITLNDEAYKISNPNWDELIDQYKKV